MQDGDRNTMYYQIKAANRKKKNHIHILRNDQGRWLEDEDQTKSHVTNFLRGLFTEVDGSSEKPSLRYGFTKLAGDVANNLGRPIENGEVEKAIFAMKAWKAPDPDSFQAAFYQSNWHMIANDFYKFASSIWQNPSSISQVNDTDICLIPKTNKPEFVTQFRPVSLCNVCYKVITKVIVSRLKLLIADIVSPFQTGFIPTGVFMKILLWLKSLSIVCGRCAERMASLLLRWTLLKPMIESGGVLFMMF